MLLAPRLIPPQRFRRIQELLALDVQRQIDDNDAEMDRVEAELRNQRREERARRPRNVCSLLFRCAQPERNLVLF
jgi:hypothetical protein